MSDAHPGLSRRCRVRRAGIGAALPPDARCGLSSARLARRPNIATGSARAERTLHDLETRARRRPSAHYGHTTSIPTPRPNIPTSWSRCRSSRRCATMRRVDASEPFRSAAELRKRAWTNSTIRKLKTMRRYLPNVGKDKDKRRGRQLVSLPSRAQSRPAGAATATRMRGACSSGRSTSAIKAARPFRLCLADPVQGRQLRRHRRGAQRRRPRPDRCRRDLCLCHAPGVSSSPATNAYLDEARTAIDAAEGMRFELNYQANLTAWGASACMRLWRITDEEHYLRQSYVYLASFFHNAAIWESEIGTRRITATSSASPCFTTRRIWRSYECFDSFAAFERYLKDSGPDLDPAARMLISEYCKYALDRAWYYYPDALPAEISQRRDPQRPYRPDSSPSRSRISTSMASQPDRSVRKSTARARPSSLRAARSTT